MGKLNETLKNYNNALMLYIKNKDLTRIIHAISFV